MKGKALILVIFALVSGILTGRIDGVNTLVAIVPLSLSTILFFLDIVFSRRNPFKRIVFIHESISVLIFYAIGLFSAAMGRPASTQFTKGEYLFSGIVSDYTPTNYGDKMMVELSQLKFINKKENICRTIGANNVSAIITLKDATNLTYGSFVCGSADLHPATQPANYLNDDYISYLHSKNIFLLGETDASKCHVEKSRNFGLADIRSLRDFIESKIESTPLELESRNFLISVLLGDKTYIKNEDRIIFSDAGVAHIFAVSGLHVSLVAGGLMLLFSLIFHGNVRKWSYLVCLLIVWFYILLVGASAATCRSGIMLSMALIALFIQRKNLPLRALGWSIVLILAFCPNALFDIGFQLSIVCVGSLILIASPLNFIDHRSHPRLFKLMSLILVTLTATFSSWLICAFYFHRFSLMFLPLNLLAIPLLPFFLLGSIVYIFIYHLGADLHFLGSSIDYIYQSFRNFAELLNSYSFRFTEIYPSSVTVMLWLSGIATLGYILGRKVKRKLLWIPAVLFILSLVSFPFLGGAPPVGFIIQKNSKETTIMAYKEGKEKLITLPEGINGMAKLNNKRIFILRDNSISDELLGSVSNADVVLICKGCKSYPEEIIENISPSCLVVTHPSLHWRYERKILAKASKSDVSIHSLRYQGPLHVFED